MSSPEHDGFEHELVELTAAAFAPLAEPLSRIAAAVVDDFFAAEVGPAELHDVRSLVEPVLATPHALHALLHCLARWAAAPAHVASNFWRVRLLLPFSSLFCHRSSLHPNCSNWSH
jgi:hypothetical protein